MLEEPVDLLAGVEADVALAHQAAHLPPHLGLLHLHHHHERRQVVQHRRQQPVLVQLQAPPVGIYGMKGIMIRYYEL